MTHQVVSRRPDSAAGFSLVELMVVFLIIAVTAGTAVPSLLAFIKNYSINGAAQDVAREIQAARNRAIMRNTNLGVSFVVIDNANYTWIMEDDVDPQTPPNWFGAAPAVNTLLTDANFVDQLGPPRILPAGVFFDGTTATDPGMRFDRYGGWCEPGVDAGCPVHAGFVGADFVENTVNGAVITITQPSTGLQRVVRVATGGRVAITPN